MKSNSWVICNKLTGKAIFETWNPNVGEALNKTVYEALPAYEYLTRLNARIKNARVANSPRS